MRLLCSGFAQESLCLGSGDHSEMAMKSNTLMVDRKLVSRAVQRGAESGKGNCLARE